MLLNFINPAANEEIYRQNWQKFLYILCGCTVVTIIIIIIWRLVLQQQIKLENNKNIIITQNLHALNERILNLKKTSPVPQHSPQLMTVIKKLQHRQQCATMILQELAALVPKNIYLSEMTKNKLHITLKGNSNLYKYIADFIANIKQSQWFKNPLLKELTVSNINHTNQFILQCTIS